MKYSQHITADAIATTPGLAEQKDDWTRLFRAGDVEAGIRLARCYELAGEMSEGLAVIDEVLKQKLSPEVRSKALLRKAVLQKDCPATAWKTVSKAFFNVSPDMCGQLHNQRGRILSDLRKFDPAIIEYTAASYYFEMVGSTELVGLAYNNLAGVYRKLKRYTQAHGSVDKAIEIWRASEYLPNALDQKALIYIAAKEYQEAHRLVSMALAQAGEHKRWEAEFLGTLSNAQAGLGEFAGSLLSIDLALSICDYLNDENLRLRMFAARKISCEIMYQVSDQAATSKALELSGGNIRQAACNLGITHSSLIKSMKKHGLNPGR